MDPSDIIKNIGEEYFNDINEFLNIPLSKWSIEMQDRVSLEKYGRQRVVENVKTWLNYLLEGNPYLVSSNSKIIKNVLENIDSISIEDLYTLPYVIGELSGKGFDIVSLKRLDFFKDNNPHYKVRNEWWSMSGQLKIGENIGYMTFHVWRHTFLPPSLWSANSCPSDYSIVKIMTSILEPGSTQTKYSKPFTFQEGWNVVKFTGSEKSEPFSIISDNGLNHMEAEYSTGVFPQRYSWDIANQKIKLQLDSEKPLFMFVSNGCTTCSDGIGKKKYTYPLVRGSGTLNGENVTFEGSWDHYWESHVTPGGYPNSFSLRSLQNIERNFYNIIDSDIWTYICVQLSNNVQLFGYFNPLHRNTNPYLFVGVNANGTTFKPKLKSISLNRQFTRDSGFGVVYILHGPNFMLKLTVTSENEKYPMLKNDENVTFMHSGCIVNGFYDDEHMSGHGYIQTTPLQDEYEKVDYLTRNIFKDFDNSLSNSTNRTQLAVSCLFWVIPVLVTAILIIFAVYLILSKRRKSSWVVDGHRTHSK